MPAEARLDSSPTTLQYSSASFLPPLSSRFESQNRSGTQLREKPAATASVQELPIPGSGGNQSGDGPIFLAEAGPGGCPKLSCCAWERRRYKLPGIKTRAGASEVRLCRLERPAGAMANDTGNPPTSPGIGRNHSEMVKFARKWPKHHRNWSPSPELGRNHHRIGHNRTKLVYNTPATLEFVVRNKSKTTPPGICSRLNPWSSGH